MDTSPTPQDIPPVDPAYGGGKARPEVGRAARRQAKRDVRRAVTPRRMKGGRHGLVVFRDAIVNRQVQPPEAS